MLIELTLLYVVALAITACGSVVDDTSHDAYTIRDSAGIRIVESSAPVWTVATEWRIEPEPVLRIGALDGDDPYLFDTVMGAVRLSDGTIVVANMGTDELRFFDAAGGHLRTVGGRGQGPGELSWTLGLSLIRGDTLVAADGGGQLSTFTKLGDYVRRVRLEAVEYAGTVVRGGFPLYDGTYMGYGWPQGREARTGVWTDSAPFFRFDRDGGSPVHLGMFAAQMWIGDGRRGRSIRFSPSFALAVGDGRFCHNFTSSFSVECYGFDGTLESVLRRAHMPELVSPALIDEARELFLYRPGEPPDIPSDVLAQRQRQFSEITFADTLPAHGPMRFDRTGHLWVEHTQQFDYTEAGRNGFGAVPVQPARHSVFDPGGVWLGDIETPGRFRIFDIGADYILGVTRDELAVEYVLLYRLMR